MQQKKLVLKRLNKKINLTFSFKKEASLLLFVSTVLCNSYAYFLEDAKGNFKLFLLYFSGKYCVGLTK